MTQQVGGSLERYNVVVLNNFTRLRKTGSTFLITLTVISNARFQFLQGWSDLLDPIGTMMGFGHLLSFLEARLGAWVSKKKLKVKVPGWTKVSYWLEIKSNEIGQK